MTRNAELLERTALEMMGEIGLDALTLAAVAQRAGVSRATAYREFGDKNGMIGAVARAEVAAMIALGYREVDLFAPLPDVVHAAVRFALTHLRGHPVIRRVRDHEPRWLLDAAIAHGDSAGTLVETVSAFVTPIVGARPDAAELAVPPEQAAEIIVRIVLSHVLIPRSGLADGDIAATAVRAVLRG
ncbi:TetR/AcrR family transcriptional regulator [Nocardia asteroides]|uniref:TetR/AcrR family transcriptional regulator n=1 Tax=Nocardia asteroides TaxID=1824 RepID=UPI001E467F5F|nr:TetR/AcrR family transcriptional regulator [Nocardia asteroides]UGT63185.1 TetR/AcrR family transcriptional regulator; helix-turn-helix transcriptional regulator [Nocardia asteroides]